MLARTHFFFGALIGVVLVPLLGKENPWLFVGLVSFASLVPDVDHMNSTINRLFPVTKLFAALFKHRGFFHSIYPVIIIYTFFWWLGLEWYGLALAIGYSSHLLSDCFTKEGINFLYPLSKIKVQGFIKTGTFTETVVFFIIVTILGLILLSRLGL